jgi:hypothetical protein
MRSSRRDFIVGAGGMTQVAGLSDRDLLNDPSRRSASTARLRWHAVVRGSTIDVLPSLFFGTARVACGSSSRATAVLRTGTRRRSPPAGSSPDTPGSSGTSRPSSHPTMP